MTNKEFYELADNDARDIALAYKSCFASYSSSTYVKRFASDRYKTWVEVLKDKDIEIPDKIEDKVRRTFCSTFTNVILDYIKSLPTTTNPYVLKVMKDSKKSK